MANLFNEPDLYIPDLARARAILFVCLGNICRSPTAQGVLEHLAVQRGVRNQLTIESRGTGTWHMGDLPDERTRRVALARGIKLTSRARVVEPATDFPRFDLIVAMDRRNRRDLVRLGCPESKLVLFGVFDPRTAEDGTLDVPDPYDHDLPVFERVLDIAFRGSQGLLDRLFPLTTEQPRA